jgi:hypothetical protein
MSEPDHKTHKTSKAALYSHTNASIAYTKSGTKCKIRVLTIRKKRTL